MLPSPCGGKKDVHSHFAYLTIVFKVQKFVLFH